MKKRLFFGLLPEVCEEFIQELVTGHEIPFQVFMVRFSGSIGIDVFHKGTFLIGY